MYILGISQGHDASAALVKDGKLIAAAEEERFNRIKHSIGFGTPVLATKYCLEHAGITPEQIDYVAVDQESPGKYYSMQIAKMLPRYIFKGTMWHRMTRFLYHSYQWSRNENPFGMKELGFPKHKYRFIRHHDAHAATAFYPSGFDAADVLILDAVGETDATTLFRGEGDTLTNKKRIAAPNSLGLLYGGLTVYLGYYFGDGEGTVMGLAPYGEMSSYYQDMEHLCKLTPNGYRVDPRVARHNVFPLDMDRLVKRFGPGPTDSYRLDAQKKYRDIAFALQKRLEDTVLHLLKKWDIGDTLCLAGGVALNCKMNGLILQQSNVKNIFIQPASGDSGGSMGAALELSRRHGAKITYTMKHAYLGPSYTNEEIEQLLENNKIAYEKVSDIEQAAGELLAQNKIVGWFQGRMEMGPRALGNRSILMNPGKPENKDKINLNVKFREPYRPFCPSMLAEAADEYLEGAYPSPYMILSFQMKPGKEKEIPAVVHTDNSCRPQTVEKDVNPRYWKVIKAFENESSVPVVLNTSLNIKGEAMACSPKDALRTFFMTGIDAMVLGDYLLQK
ncbi:MAG: hypothetical protein KKA90_01895 [Nanoarchaeota archaeon]|nr:hypothetical protein [Nanoarchaeota archaeon]